MHKYLPKTPASQAFLLTGIIQGLIVIILQGYIFTRWQNWLTPISNQVPVSRTVPTYFSLLVFNSVYSILLIYDALYHQNSIQLVASVLQGIGLIIYTAIQPGKMHGTAKSLPSNRDQYGHSLVHLDMDFWGQVKVVIVLIPGVIAVATVVLGVLAWKVIEEFQWLAYRDISADVKLKRKYLFFQLYLVFLKVDFFFIISFMTQIIVEVANLWTFEFIITFAFIPVIIAILIFAGIWARNENKIGTCFVIIAFSLMLAYFIYKMIDMFKMNRTHFMYEAALPMLAIFGTFNCVFVFLTIVNSVICFGNFGQGLKPIVSSKGGVREGMGLGSRADLDLDLGLGDPNRRLVGYEDGRFMLD